MIDVRKRTDLVKLIDKMGLKKCAEIGVEQGRFSQYLLENSNLDILYSIDAWTTDNEAMKAYRSRGVTSKVNTYYKETIKRLTPYGNRSKIIKDLSLDAVMNFQDQSLDFIYLDASHLFVGFTMDLINWWEKLKWGGLFAGHDFRRKPTYQVCYALNGFCLEKKQLYYLTSQDAGGRKTGSSNPSWWLVKTPRRRKAYMLELAEYAPIIRKQAAELNKFLQVDIFYECQD